MTIFNLSDLSDAELSGAVTPTPSKKSDDIYGTGITENSEFNLDSITNDELLDGLDKFKISDEGVKKPKPLVSESQEEEAKLPDYMDPIRGAELPRSEFTAEGGNLLKTPEVAAKLDQEQKDLDQGYLSEGNTPSILDIPARMMHKNKKDFIRYFAHATDSSPAFARVVKNAPESATNFYRGMYNMVANPVDTFKSFSDLSLGIAKLGLESGITLTTGEEAGEILPNMLMASPEQKAKVEALTAELKNRYGSIGALEQTMIKDPVGFMSDLMGVAVPVLRAGGLKTAAAIADTLDPFNAPMQLGKVMKYDELIKDTADNIASSEVAGRMNFSNTKIRENLRNHVAGDHPAEWLSKKGIIGSPEYTRKRTAQIASESKEAVDDIFRKIDEEKTLGINPKPVRNILASMEETLSRVKFKSGEFNTKAQTVAELQDKLKRGLITTTELNNLKRTMDEDLNMYAKNGDLMDNTEAKNFRGLRDELKTLLEDLAAEEGYTKVRELNKDTQVSAGIRLFLEETKQFRKGKDRKKGLINRFDAVDYILGHNIFYGDSMTQKLGWGGLLALNQAYKSDTLRTVFARVAKNVAGDKMEDLAIALHRNETNPKLKVLADLITRKVAFEIPKEMARAGMRTAIRTQMRLDDRALQPSGTIQP